MFPMRLTCFLAVTALLGVVQGCSTRDDSSSLGDDGTSGTSGTTQKKTTKSNDDDDDTTSGDDTGGTSGTTPAPTTTATTPAPPTTPAKSAMTFFVSSTPAGTGGTASGNLGGLTGADTLCQTLATAVNGGDHTWHAYLSTLSPATNAKDRIGTGPWQNQKGTVIAQDVASLHATTFSLGANALDEKGAAVPTTGRYILTGSNADGTPSGNDCTGWTNNTKNQGATLGDGAYDPNTNPYVGASFSFAKGVFDKNRVTCDPAGIAVLKNSEGRVYCFATN